MNGKKRSKAKLILLGALIILFSVNLFVAAEEIIIPELAYHNFQLDNGLEVYVFEDDSIPLVEVSIFYKIGSIDEEEGLSGIAHFLEHTMFLGTEALPQDRLDELIKAVGGYHNASTGYDYTRYYIEVPSSMLELAMAIEADRMVNLKLDPVEIEREREVIHQERRRSIENNVVTAGMEITQATAFPQSPLKHQVIGWREDIDRIKAEDIQRYYDTYYVPNNAVMVVAGDAKPEEVKKLAEKYFAGYEKRELVPREFKEERQDREIVTEIELYTNIPITLMLYKIPEGDHRDILGINVFLDILVNNQSSRIKQELQNKNKIILEAGSFVNSIRVPGFALVYFVPANEGLIEEARKAFDLEVERMIKEGIEREEFQAVKKAHEKSLVFRQRSTAAMANKVAYSKLSYDKPDLDQEQLAYLNQLTAEEIAEVAGKYFTPEKRVVGNIVPLKE